MTKPSPPSMASPPSLNQTQGPVSCSGSSPGPAAFQAVMECVFAVLDSPKLIYLPQSLGAGAVLGEWLSVERGGASLWGTTAGEDVTVGSLRTRQWVLALKSEWSALCPVPPRSQISLITVRRALAQRQGHKPASLMGIVAKSATNQKQTQVTKRGECFFCS